MFSRSSSIGLKITAISQALLLSRSSQKQSALKLINNSPRCQASKALFSSKLTKSQFSTANSTDKFLITLLRNQLPKY
jgi:hypothetical protein